MKVQFNLNEMVTIKPTDKGIHLMVDRYNINGLPKKHHTNYEKQKAKVNGKGEITMQMHEFMDYFGYLGISLWKYVDLNLEIRQ